MTDQDQIKAIAELDGYTFDTKPDFHSNFWIWKDGKTIAGDNESVNNVLHTLPPYLTSYDAIIPVIQKQGLVFSVQSLLLNSHPEKAILSFSPAQLSKTLLRSTGKWKD